MTSHIGKSIPRFDAYDKVTGKAKYPADFDLPNQLTMKILFAGRSHAMIKSIDISRAERLPGVVAVLTARDVPVNEYGLIMPDQPVLCGPDSTKPYAEYVRFQGDNVALVIAEDEEIASAAIRMIDVVYEDLPGIYDPRQAILPQAMKLHPERDSNIFCQFRIRKGDVEAAFKRADVIIEGEYHTPAQEHAYLQPEAGIAYWDEEKRITIVVAGQWTHEDQEQVAHALDLPKERIRIIYPAIGGAFGGREDMSVQIVLGLAVLRLHEKGIDRPVKIVWSREESMIGHHKRHPFFIKTKWAANKEGKLLAAKVELIADGGAYAYTSTKVLGNATLMCTGPYFIPNVAVDSYAVYTNNIPTGAFRGFGGPQGAFSAECQVSKLAEKLGIDPVEFRMRNIIKEGELLSVGSPLPPGVSAGEVTEKCALLAGWKQVKGEWQKPELRQNFTGKNIRRGLGFACAFKNVGFSFGAQDHCTATIELHGTDKIERVVLYHAGADVGQGSHSAFKQMAAEALNVSVTRIELVASDTARTDNSGSASASRMTFMAGNAIKGASAEAMRKWKAEERPAIARYQYLAPKTSAYDEMDGHAVPNFAYGYVAEAADVEVDMETGKIKVLNIYCVNDVGQAVNPQQVEGQIEGGIVQALGYTVLENFIQKEGAPVTRQLSTYLIPTVLDIPDKVTATIHQHPDPRGPWGARGMGEMPFLPLAPAVVAAVRQAIGCWADEFPLTPELVLSKACLEKEK
jgi:CO/xanthine dehydrogenase Mo-binding subunit